MRYQVDLEEELRQVRAAAEYYHQWCDEIRSGVHQDEKLNYYYRGLLDSSQVKRVRFRTLYFAMRLQPVLSWIEQFRIEHEKPPRILDLGCGYGVETRLLLQQGAVVHGLDSFDEKIQWAVSRNADSYADASPNISFECGNILTWQPSEPFNAVFSSATMHHIEPAPDAMQAIAQILKVDGRFFLCESNGMSPMQQLFVQKRIGWTSKRVMTTTDPETGKTFPSYGNENIRPLSVWHRLAKPHGLCLANAKFCRFLPPLDWPMERLVKAERIFRNLPLLANLTAIGFLAEFRRR